MPIIDSHRTVLYFQALQLGQRDGRKLLLDKIIEVERSDNDVHDLHDDIAEAAADAIERLELDDDPEILEMSTLMVQKLAREAERHPPRKGYFKNPTS